MIEPYYKKRERRYRYGQAQLDMIEAIQGGIIISIHYAVTQLPGVLRNYFKKQGPKRFHQTIKSLEKRGVIHLSGEVIKLTKKGKELAKKFQLEKVTILIPKKWDKIWRLVSYDIPEKLKDERNWFRYSLQRLRFRKIHESLWVYPFECEEEIALIAFNLNVSAHVVYMVTNHLPNQEKMEKSFNLASASNRSN